MLVFPVTRFVALLAGWARLMLVDSHEFAVRATVTLDGAAVRRELAEQRNSEAALMARVQQCQAQRGRRPTILAVDLASVGDLMGVVDKLNGT